MATAVCEAAAPGGLLASRVPPIRAAFATSFEGGRAAPGSRMRSWCALSPRSERHGCLSLRAAGSGEQQPDFRKVFAQAALSVLLVMSPAVNSMPGMQSLVSAEGRAQSTSNAETVQEQLHELTSRIDKIERERIEQESKTAKSFGLEGTPPFVHTDDEFQTLISKMKAKHAEPSTKKRPQMVTGAHRAPRAEYSGAGKYRQALKDAGYSLREANRLLILEAWDIIHRGSYGYPGWYDPNNGLYVDPQSFYADDRKQLVRSISDDDLASPAVAHDVIRRMVADLQDPYSRFQEASEITMNIDDHSKPGRPARGREHIEEGPPPESSGLPQARPSHLALDSGKRLVGVGLQLADPLDGREDLVVVAPIPNSPAEAAGIKPLDRLLRIDDLDVSKYRLTTSEATNLLRGWEDTDVRLLVQRARNGDGSIPPVFDAMGDRLPRQRPSESWSEISDTEGGSKGGKNQDERTEESGDGAVEEIILKRKKLNIPPVQSALIKPEGDGGESRSGQTVGYIRVNYFSRVGTAQIAQTVADMEAKHVAGYIIDVRNCLGGLLKEALVTASMFQEELPASSSPSTRLYHAPQKCRVETGCVDRVVADASQRGDGDSRGKLGSRSLTLLNIMDASGLVRAETLDDQRDLDRWPDTGGHPLEHPVTRKPIELLTNRGSASASEVLAMSLAGNGRAHIIGERTFGKALIQHPYKLADGSLLTITVAEYLSPGPNVRHLGAGLLPQAPCTFSPIPPSVSGTTVKRDLCIAAAETDISALLGWRPERAVEEGRRVGEEQESVEVKGPQEAQETVSKSKRVGSMSNSLAVGLPVPPANAISPGNLPPPPPPLPEAH